MLIRIYYTDMCISWDFRGTLIIRNQFTMVHTQQNVSRFSPRAHGLPRSQVLGHFSSVRYGFHFMEWTINILFNAVIFVSLLHQYILQASLSHRSQGLWLCDTQDYLPFSVGVQSMFQHHEH